MAEAIPIIGPLISAGGAIAGAGIQSQAAGQAAEAQLEGTRLGIAANERAREQARKDTSALRDYTASSVDRLAAQLGFSTGAFEDTASGFSLPARAAGPSRDPYEDPNRRTYPEIVAPYLQQLTPIRQNAESLMRMFTAPMDEGGQPTWYRNALAGFKQSPGYQFARDESLRQFNQSAQGNIMGGGRLREGERLASGYAAQDYDKFRENLINSILSGAKVGMGATQQSADLLNSALQTDVGSFQMEDQRYTNFFNRLLSSAGLGSAATSDTAKLGTQSGTNAAQLYQNLGTAEAKGITQSANALGTGITNALAPLTSERFTTNLQNYLSSNSSGGGSSDAYAGAYSDGYSNLGY